MDEYFSKLECSCCIGAKAGKTIAVIYGKYPNPTPYNWCSWHSNRWRVLLSKDETWAPRVFPSLHAKVFDRTTGQLIETWSNKDGKFHIEPNPNYEPEKDSGGARLPQTDATDHAGDRG